MSLFFKLSLAVLVHLVMCAFYSLFKLRRVVQGVLVSGPRPRVFPGEPASPPPGAASMAAAAVATAAAANAVASAIAAPRARAAGDWW